MESRRFRFGGPGDALWLGEPGDVVEQHGPRIGYRYWLVIDVHHARRWSHVEAVRLDGNDIAQAIVDANADGPGHVWHINRDSIHA